MYFALRELINIEEYTTKIKLPFQGDKNLVSVTQGDAPG